MRHRSGLFLHETSQLPPPKLRDGCQRSLSTPVLKNTSLLSAYVVSHEDLRIHPSLPGSACRWSSLPCKYLHAHQCFVMTLGWKSLHDLNFKKLGMQFVPGSVCREWGPEHVSPADKLPSSHNLPLLLRIYACTYPCPMLQSPSDTTVSFFPGRYSWEESDVFNAGVAFRRQRSSSVSENACPEDD